LRLAYEPVELAYAAAVLNAANEVAVDAFLNGQISFVEIHRSSKGHEHSSGCSFVSLEAILQADQWARGSQEVAAFKPNHE